MKEEATLQSHLVKWFRTCYPNYILFSVPNEATHTRSGYFRSLGCLSGAADLVMVLPSAIIFLELKAAKGKQSKEQIDFQKKVTELGYQYYVIKDLHDLKEVLKNNLYVDEWVDL